MEIFSSLERRGAKVSYHDPYVAVLPITRQHELAGRSVILDPSYIRHQDCVLICTDHSNVEYELIRDNAMLIVDTRGVYKADGKRIVSA